MGNKALSVESQLGSNYPEQERFYGLQNFGNTCYTNAVLQALYACKPFRTKILEYYEENKKRKESESLLMCLSALFSRISTSKRRSGIMGPAKLIRKIKRLNPQFEGHQHQDAQEFLNFMLNEVADNLRTDMKEEKLREKYGDKPRRAKQLRTGKAKEPDDEDKALTKELAGVTTWVQAIFEGTLTNQTKCLRCETVTSRDEKFLDLSLDIEPNSSITHCLRQFSAREMLNGKEKYFCDCCSCRQEASKCMQIKQLPEIAILHMKRFKYIEGLEAFKKLCYRVVFPIHLRLINTVPDVEDRAYKLIAIVVHIGSGMLYGHYTCFVKNNDDWFLYDDDKIYMVTEDDIKTCFGSLNTKHKQDGYLLFYQMINEDKKQ